MSAGARRALRLKWSAGSVVELFVSYADGYVGMWDPWTQGGIKHKITAHVNPDPKQSVVSSMVISPDGTVLATAGFDSLIKIWGPGVSERV